MTGLLVVAAVTALAVAYLLVKDPGAGRGCVGFAAGIGLVYAAAVGWLPPGAGLAGVAVIVVALFGVIYGWWG